MGVRRDVKPYPGSMDDLRNLTERKALEDRGMIATGSYIDGGRVYADMSSNQPKVTTLPYKSV